MIGIIDYGMGNLHSVQNALNHLGFENLISASPQQLAACDRLILPGVGAMGDCMKNLEATGLKAFVEEQVTAGKPLLGICLGMQALFESSEENGGVPAFGFLKGRVVAMSDPGVRIPHIGWNELNIREDAPVKGQSEHPFVYFDHTYYAADMDPDDLISYAQYGPYQLPGMVGHGTIWGTQFHPEKSAQEGLAILDWFGRKEFA